VKERHLHAVRQRWQALLQQWRAPQPAATSEQRQAA
jgi:hypothetical protein